MSYIFATLHHNCLDPMEKLIVPWNPWQILYITLISKTKPGKLAVVKNLESNLPLTSAQKPLYIEVHC